MGGVTAMATGMRLTARGGQAAMLITGGNDGIINVWSAERGTLLQSINVAQHTKGDPNNGRTTCATKSHNPSQNDYFEYV